MGADEALESELGLGELAGLTVANEADSLTYDVSGSFVFVFVFFFLIVHFIEKDDSSETSSQVWNLFQF